MGIIPILRCNFVHIFKGQCTLIYGHKDNHEFANPTATGPELTDKQKESFK